MGQLLAMIISVEVTDALAGASLAKAKNVLILLTNSSSLYSPTSDEIKRLGAKKAYIIGGEGVVSSIVK